MSKEHLSSVDYNNLSDEDRQSILQDLAQLRADIIAAIEVVNEVGNKRDREELDMRLAQIMKPLNESVAVMEGKEPEKNHHKIGALISFCMKQAPYFRYFSLRMQIKKRYRHLFRD